MNMQKKLALFLFACGSAISFNALSAFPVSCEEKCRVEYRQCLNDSGNTVAQCKQARFYCLEVRCSPF